MCIWILRNEYQMVWYSFLVNVAIVYVNTQFSEDCVLWYGVAYIMIFSKASAIKVIFVTIITLVVFTKFGHTWAKKKFFLFVGYVTQYVCRWCDMLIFSLLLGIWKIKFWFASLYLFTCGSEKTYAKEKYVGSLLCNIYLFLIFILSRKVVYLNFRPSVSF